MAVTVQSEILLVSEEADLVPARNKARAFAKEVKLGLVDETKLVTAVSELTRNMIVYAGGGKAIFEKAVQDNKEGVRVTFEDSGPGIADVNLAMKDGWSSGSGLGLGLPGSKRLVHDFEIRSRVGEGTRIVITRWKM